MNIQVEDSVSLLLVKCLWIFLQLSVLFVDIGKNVHTVLLEVFKCTANV